MMINKIYNESCLDTMQRMNDNYLDLTVTSPPYDNLRSYKNDIDKTWGEHVWKPIIKELFRVTKQGGVVVWVVGDATIKGSESGTSFKQALYAIECGFNLHDTMIYSKPNALLSHNRYEQDFEYMFIFSKEKPKTWNGIKDKKNKHFGEKVGGTKRDVKSGVLRKSSGIKKGKTIQEFGLRGNIWYIPNRDKVKGHPAPFPEQLANDHIISWSNEGDLVYDPFMGSGTTAKMATINKRNWIGSEMSEEYCQIINKRLAQFKNIL